MSLWLDQGLPRNNDDFLLLAGGVVLVVISAVRFAWVRLSWVTVVDTSEGIIVSDRRGRRDCSDEQIVQTAVSTTDGYSNAKLVSTIRTFDAWVEERPGGKPRRIRLLNTIPLGSTDPLAALIQRLNSRLTDSARRALERGMKVTGDGWSLDGSELVFGSGTGTQAISLDEITALRESDGQFCIWAGSDELPRFRCPVNGGNAWLLASLLNDRLARRPAISDSPATELGRVIFERRPGILPRFLLWAALGGMVAIIPSWIAAMRLNVELLWIAPILTTVASPIVFLATQPYAKILRCHELAISVGLLGWRRTLRFSDAITYTEKTVAHFHNGMYYGTVIDLDIVGRSGARQIAISYATKYYHQDPELDNLRDHVSQVIAARWQVQLTEGHDIPWTAALTFLPGSLRHQPKGLLARPSPEMIPYDTINRCEFNAGNLWIGTVDNAPGKPKLNIPAGTCNLFPGFVLLQRLRASRVTADSGT